MKGFSIRSERFDLFAAKTSSQSRGHRFGQPEGDRDAK